MKRLIIFLLFAIFGLGILAFSNKISFFQRELDNTTIAQTKESKFRLLNGSFYGDNATYTFQTPPEEKNYADDCIGCKQEVGNAVIFAEFGCPKKVKYLFESNSKNGVVEKGKKLDKNGVEIGERRLVVFKDKGKIYGARVFWVEGNDFWAVQAPTIELTKALEESEEYYKVRKKVAEEKENYVPIQNANTERIKATKEKECNEK
ncbi:MAG: hypothetical protein AAB336_13805 [Acidobacteriota bacterium]